MIFAFSPNKVCYNCLKKFDDKDGKRKNSKTSIPEFLRWLLGRVKILSTLLQGLWLNRICRCLLLFSQSLSLVFQHDLPAYPASRHHQQSRPGWGGQVSRSIKKEETSCTCATCFLFRHALGRIIQSGWRSTWEKSFACPTYSRFYFAIL